MATRGLAVESEPGRLQSVQRALAVLEILASRPRGVTPKELSHALGLHLSTSYRLLNTLVAAGYVARSPATGLFRLAQRVAYLHNGFLAAFSQPAALLACVHALQLATGETSMLTRLAGDDMVATAVVAGSNQDARPAAYVGMAAPAHAFAAGRVLIAWLPEDQREARLARWRATPDSPFPLLNPQALRTELEQIRRSGFALDRGEGHPDVCCIAAPVGVDRGTPETAVSLMVSCSRLRREEPALVSAVLAMADAMSGLTLNMPEPNEHETAGDLAVATTQAEIEAALAAVAEEMSRVCSLAHAGRQGQASNGG